MPGQWRNVAKLSDLEPEYPFLVKIGKVEIALCLVGSEVFAVDNICSHAFARLSDGTVENFDVICPLHDGAFDLRTGEPTSAPCDSPIKTYRTKVDEHHVWIEWDADA